MVFERIGRVVLTREIEPGEGRPSHELTLVRELALLLLPRVLSTSSPLLSRFLL